MLVPNLASLYFLARRVRRSFGRDVAAAALLMSATQFHLAFYMSRTLPNMLAFPFGAFTICDAVVALHESQAERL